MDQSDLYQKQPVKNLPSFKLQQKGRMMSFDQGQSKRAWFQNKNIQVGLNCSEKSSSVWHGKSQEMALLFYLTRPLHITYFFTALTHQYPLKVDIGKPKKQPFWMIDRTARFAGYSFSQFLIFCQQCSVVTAKQAHLGIS